MVKIEVSGMSCGGCVNSVSKIITRAGGFSPDDIEVDLDAAVAQFPDTDDETMAQILTKLGNAGFASTPKQD